MTISNNTNINETKKVSIVDLIKDYENIKKENEPDHKENILNELADKISEINDYNVLVQNAYHKTVDDVMSKKQKVFWTIEEGIVKEVADEEALYEKSE